MESSQKPLDDLHDAVCTCIRLNTHSMPAGGIVILSVDDMATAIINVINLHQRRAIRAMGYTAMLKHMANLWTEYYAGEAERDKRRDARAGL